MKIPETNNYKINLDTIQTAIFQYLKPLGFRKKGRTFNRETEKGIVQVINLQSGQYPIGEHYIIPGIRESYYGKFTINMGILIEEVHNLRFPKKPFYYEHYCQIRKRLPELSKGRDFWWDLSAKPEEIAKEIIEELNWAGLPWFDLFKTREIICKSFSNNSTIQWNAKFLMSIILLQKERKRAGELFQEYYDSIENNIRRKEYLKTLAAKLGVTLK